MVRIIFGRVKDRETNSNLPNVNVSFGNISFTTDGLGNYFLRNVPPQSGIIEFKISGYETLTEQIEAPLDPDGQTEFNVFLTKIPVPKVPKEPSIIPEETTGFWINQGFTNQEAEVISNFVINNQQTPSEETINQILIDAGLREPEKETIIDQLKDLFSKDNFVGFFQILKDSFTGDLDVPGSESVEIYSDIILSLIPIGRVGVAGKELAERFGIKGLSVIAGRLGERKIAPEVIEELISKGAIDAVLNEARKFPVKFADVMGKLKEPVKSIVLKGIKEQTDPTAFNLAVKEIARVRGKEGLSIFHRIIPVKDHPFLTASAVLVGMNTILGFDIWGNWQIIDNLGFTLNKEAQAARDLFINGELTKEEALAELDRLINLSEEGAEKVRLSAALNPIQLLFLPLWDEQADENTKLLKTVRANIESVEIKEGEINIISLDVFPTVAEIGRSITLTPKLSSTFDEDTRVEIELFIEREDGVSQKITQIENVIVPANFSTDASHILETSNLLGGFYNVFVNVLSVETGETLKGRRFPNAFQLTKPEEEIPPLPPEEVTGKLIISVIPSDAIITVAGHEEITTPGEFLITTGPKGVKAEKEGFESQTKNVFVRSDIDVQVSFILKEILPPEIEEPEIPPIQPKEAIITFTSNPTNAELYINGIYTFTSTPSTKLLPAGNYIFRVQKKGFFPVEIIGEVMEGESDTVDFLLSEIPPEITPTRPFIPFIPETPKGFETLFPQPLAPILFDSPVPSSEKEILINIETTDLKPWKGRIFSIAYQDLSVPLSDPSVLINDNEEELLGDFIQIFEAGNFRKLIGFKLSFDYRYIFNKLMLYRLKSKKFKEIELRDVKQLLDQVKEEFVYFPDKTGKLDDYGKELLGKGKFGSQKDLLKMFLAKNFPYVEAFQMRQIEVTKGLYDLFRFSAVEGSSIETGGSSHLPSTTESSSNPSHLPNPRENQCKNCLQVNPLDKTECIVCGDKLA